MRAEVRKILDIPRPQGGRHLRAGARRVDALGQHPRDLRAGHRRSARPATRSSRRRPSSCSTTPRAGSSRRRPTSSGPTRGSPGGCARRATSRAASRCSSAVTTSARAPRSEHAADGRARRQGERAADGATGTEARRGAAGPAGVAASRRMRHSGARWSDVRVYAACLLPLLAALTAGCGGAGSGSAPTSPVVDGVADVVDPHEQPAVDDLDPGVDERHPVVDGPRPIRPHVHSAPVPQAGAEPTVRFPPNAPAVGVGRERRLGRCRQAEWARMVGYSWTSGCPVGRSQLQLRPASTSGASTAGATRGALVVNSSIAPADGQGLHPALRPQVPDPADGPDGLRGGGRTPRGPAPTTTPPCRPTTPPRSTAGTSAAPRPARSTATTPTAGLSTSTTSRTPTSPTTGPSTRAPTSCTAAGPRRRGVRLERERGRAGLHRAGVQVGRAVGHPDYQHFER